MLNQKYYFRVRQKTGSKPLQILAAPPVAVWIGVNFQPGV
ncbi:hypothetical protein SAMN04488692_101132 [Halarsenatibacter silvermanii]|uniref:Uncharacterized protein n=1 Tax=Halarsenatibacter silvermanii TaxID=321763 RepID=A0A1G9H7Y9_9FIRM|nr:hypothetical protein SAMN04488692_101132 [Halarsenatibacter silvermanii]